MARTNNRGGRNNNPSGRNQYSGSWTDTVTERPFTAAAAVGGAVAAGVFLWSRRNQISDQIANLSQQISDWREGMGSEEDLTGDEGESFIARPSNRRSTKSQSDIAEEALTLKSAGKKSKRPADPTVDEQTEAGAVAH